VGIKGKKGGQGQEMKRKGLKWGGAGGGRGRRTKKLILLRVCGKN